LVTTKAEPSGITPQAKRKVAYGTKGSLPSDIPRVANPFTKLVDTAALSLPSNLVPGYKEMTQQAEKQFPVTSTVAGVGGYFVPGAAGAKMVKPLLTGVKAGVKKNIVEDSNIDIITENVKGILENKLIESIDQMLLFSMSELGRTTTSIYGQIKESIGTFTVSNLTTSDSIIQKIEYADVALKELNSIGLKHVIVSNLLFEKIKNHIVETKLKINHKLVSYQILPEHLESTDPLCLICTSQSPDDLTPGIVMVYKNLILDIVENTNRDSLEFHLSKEYSIQKVGKRPEFFYIRFLQT
jgi:hypothetical protein